VSGTGPPVVLLHGQPGSGIDWALVSRRLATDFEVVTPDRPGWGRTGGAAGGFALNARAVIELLDRLGHQRVIVVGHSWGGGVALALAVDHPQRVAGVVLVASVAPGAPASVADRALGAPGVGDYVVPVAFGLAGRLLAFALGRRLFGRAAPGLSAMALLAAIGDRDVLAPDGGLAPHHDVLAPDALASGRAGSDDERHAQPRGVHRAAGRAFTVEQRAYLSELDTFAAGLAAITVPVEVVTGDSDHVVAPRLARDLATAIPTAVLHEVTGAGHLLLLDHPDEVEAAVRAASRRARSLE
jgi:pimeloyl-ACP methyl ester carboxylesterase